MSIFLEIFIVRLAGRLKKIILYANTNQMISRIFFFHRHFFIEKKGVYGCDSGECLISF